LTGRARIKFNKSFGVEFSNPDFVKLAESFGAKGVKVERAVKFALRLKKALDDGGIWIFDVEVTFHRIGQVYRCYDASHHHPLAAVAPSAATGC
jgi:thiamine pyrophosphate-dependent acetolactate synthase large subunit-like protein